jgi:hypothetical protein
VAFSSAAKPTVALMYAQHGLAGLDVTREQQLSSLDELSLAEDWVAPLALERSP